jgi:hypothetical protein
MMRGLVSHDNGPSLDYCSNERPISVPSDWRLSSDNVDVLYLHRPEHQGDVVHYFSHIKFDQRESAIDKLRRSYKAIVESKRCPGCNWVPKWKSAVGPFPLTTEAVVWCSKKCKERIERAKHDSKNTTV